MHVYICVGDKVKRTPAVHLDSCMVPRVGGYREEMLDPAVWYKALLLDSVYVNCDPAHPVVYWTTENTQASTRLHDTNSKLLNVSKLHQIFTNKELLVGDDLDPAFSELFELAQVAFYKLDSSDRKHNKCTTLLQLLVRLLHVYILPKVQLNAKQCSGLSEALSLIDSELEDMDNLMQDNFNATRTIQASLKSMRKTHIKSGHVLSHSRLSKLDTSFLRVFMEHVTEDIDYTRRLLKQFEEQINPLRQSTEPDDVATLKLLRAHRNHEHTEFDQLLYTREEIALFLRANENERDSKRKKQSDSTTYMKLSEQLDALRAEMKELEAKKGKVMSVHDQALSTHAQLRHSHVLDSHSCVNSLTKYADMTCDCEQETVNTDNNGNSVTATEPNNGNSVTTTEHNNCSSVTSTQLPPHWPTTMDRVVDLLNNEQVCFGEQYRYFYTEMAGDYATMIATTNGGHDHDQTGLVCSEMAEKACRKINEHLLSMSANMATELRMAVELDKTSASLPTVTYRNVYLCYELYVSKQLGGVLTDMFNIAHAKPCDELMDWISNQPITPLQHEMDSSESTDELRDQVSVIIQSLNDDVCLADKLRQVLKLVKCLESFISNQDVANGNEDGDCSAADDFLTVCVSVISQLEAGTLHCLYSQLELVYHLCPDFLLNGCYGFSMVTVRASFQHLFNEMATASTNSGRLTKHNIDAPVIQKL